MDGVVAFNRSKLGSGTDLSFLALYFGYHYKPYNMLIRTKQQMKNGVRFGLVLEGFHVGLQQLMRISSELVQIVGLM